MPDVRNKLSLVLFDDLPLSTDTDKGIPVFDGEGFSRSYRYKLMDLFHLWWLRHPAEMREFYQLSRTLKQLDPETLCMLGVVPEILVFDFALTHGPKEAPSEEVRAESNPLPSMRRAVRTLGQEPEELEGSPFPPPENYGYQPGGDRFGCYAGGLVVLEFSDSVTVGVPTTAYASREETFFFEWFLEQPLYGMFDKKSRPAARWDELLAEALPLLRRRIAERIRAGSIQASIPDLLKLQRGELRLDEWLQEGIGIRSLYGERQLPYEGLFFDLLHPDRTAEPLEPGDCTGQVGDWAAACLDGLLNRIRGGSTAGTKSDLEAARDLAERYWEARISPACTLRYELSYLAAKPAPSRDEIARIRELCETVGVDGDAVLEDPSGVEVPDGDWKVPQLANAQASELAKRWAALMLAVRTEQHLLMAREDLRWFLDFVAEQAPGLGEVYLEDLTEMIGMAEAKLLMSELRLHRTEDGAGTTLAPQVRRSADVNDVFISLDPLPVKVLAFTEGKKPNKKGVRAAQPTLISNRLKGLGDRRLKGLGDRGPGSWGELCLQMSDVLKSRTFDCIWCAQAIEAGAGDGDHPDDQSHGIRSGEGMILRDYAREHGFPEDEWPKWLKNAP